MSEIDNSNNHGVSSGDGVKSFDGDKGNASARGHTTKPVLAPTSVGNFFALNKGRLAPTTGIMTGNEVKRFYENLAIKVESLKDIGEADYPDLERGLLFIFVAYGGEDRNYIAERSVSIVVGGQTRELCLADILSALSGTERTIRAYTRYNTQKVIEVMNTEAMRSYMKQSFGDEVDVLSCRGDLLHRSYMYKHEAVRRGKIREDKLKNANEDDRPYFPHEPDT